jgi:hypothetical protein
VQVGAGPFGGVGWFGPNSFGLLLVPLIVGIGLVCLNGRSPVGRVLVAGGAVLVVASVLDTLRITFRTTSLFDTLMMLGLLVAGVGLMARTLVLGHEQSASFEVEQVDEDGMRRRFRCVWTASSGLSGCSKNRNKNKCLRRRQSR